MPFKAVRARVATAPPPPAPVPILSTSPTTTQVQVVFDLPLQPGSGSSTANFPVIISQRPLSIHRLLRPFGTWSVPGGAPDTLILNKAGASATALPGRVQYDPTAGAILIGANGQPVQAFDISVPFP